MSHRPLEQLRKEAKAANRSPHLRKKHLPGADTIDSLDRTMFGLAYHHEGPYDATLLARNTSSKYSPVEAVRGTNEEAIRATPKEYIKDSLTKHVPLQGTAVIPPGELGFDGRPMEYEEGADLMREEDAPGGAYKRWDGFVSLVLCLFSTSLTSSEIPSWRPERQRRTIILHRESAQGTQRAQASSSRVRCRIQHLRNATRYQPKPSSWP